MPTRVTKQTAHSRVQSQRKAVELAQSAGTFADPLSVGPLPYWLDLPRVWDTVRMDGEDLPGLCRITGLGIELAEQTKKIAGKDGGTIVTRGLEVPKFTIECMIVSRRRAHEPFDNVPRLGLDQQGNEKIYKVRSAMEVWAEFATRFPDFIPAPGAGKRDYRQVYHPALALCRITSILVIAVRLKLPEGGQPLIAYIDCKAALPPGGPDVTHKAEITQSADNPPVPFTPIQPGASAPDLERPSTWPGLVG